MPAAVNTSSAPPADRTLVLTRTFEAPRELVFEAWSSPQHLAHWFGPTDFKLPHCKMDFRVGGHYQLCMLSPQGKEYWVHGVYREIVKPQRIVFTWERDGEDDEHAGHTVITITLESRGARRTLLTLHQATFETTEIRDGHAGGWSQAFKRLDEYVEELRIERTGS
jgi:uncharacterized protein YndB with AHSA1/START domain